jgi:hypothetical protein
MLGQKFLLTGFRVLFWACTFAICAATLSPGPAISIALPSDKLQHLVAFYSLAWLAAASYPKARLLMLGVALIGLGGLIEVLQGTELIRRDAELWDWGADAAGVVLALAPIPLGRWRRYTNDAALRGREPALERLTDAPSLRSHRP